MYKEYIKTLNIDCKSERYKRRKIDNNIHFICKKRFKKNKHRSNQQSRMTLNPNQQQTDTHTPLQQKNIQNESIVEISIKIIHNIVGVKM